MRRRAILALLCCAFSAGGALGKDKPKVPAEILQARTVAVVMYPGSEVPLASPGENRTAVANVEAAIMKWHRFMLVDPTDAELIIAVRKGRRGGPAITGGDNPVTVTTGDAIHIGVHSGTPPPADPRQPTNTKPRMTSTVGSEEDALLVYRGRGMSREDPLDGPALWRYSGKRGLDAPAVPAIEAFRKAIEEAEKKKP